MLFLNPAAFKAPTPGTFGNGERNSLHGAGVQRVDFVASKPFSTGAARHTETWIRRGHLFGR